MQPIPLWVPFDPRRSNGDSVPLPLYGKGIKGEDRHPARIYYSDKTGQKRYGELHRVHGSSYLTHPELPTPKVQVDISPKALCELDSTLVQISGQSFFHLVLVVPEPVPH